MLMCSMAILHLLFENSIKNIINGSITQTNKNEAKGIQTFINQKWHTNIYRSYKKIPSVLQKVIKILDKYNTILSLKIRNFRQTSDPMI